MKPEVKSGTGNFQDPTPSCDRSDIMVIIGQDRLLGGISPGSYGLPVSLSTTSKRTY